MAQPPVYTPAHSFLSDVANLPAFPGQSVDIELAAIAAALRAYHTNLALIQRDDGALKSGIVTLDALSTDVQALIGDTAAFNTLKTTLIASATAAAASATTAGTYASSISGSVSAAAASATAAAASATNAAASAVAAAASAALGAGVNSLGGATGVLAISANLLMTGSTLGVKNVATAVYNVVVDYGADPTGAADSTTAIQNAINAAGATGYGGIIYFPPGTYKVSGSPALTVTTTSIVLRGAGRLSSFMKHTSATPSIIAVTNSYFELDSMGILGPDATVITSGTMISLSGAHGSKITNCYIANGWIPISLTTSTNCLIQFNKIDNVYGTVFCNFGSGGGGNYVINNQFDSAYFPLVTFTPSATLGAARAASTAYTVGQMVSSGNYWFVCSTAGTSVGTGTITPSYFGNPTVDPGGGTLRWKLIAKTDLVIISNISAPQNYIAFNDMTAVCSYCLQIVTSDGTLFTGNQGGGAMTAFINLGATNTRITIAQNYFTASNLYGIIDTAGTSTDVIIANNILSTMANNAINLSFGKVSVSGNIIRAAGYVSNVPSISVAANVTGFNITGGNMVAGSGQSSAAAIQIAFGTSDKYNIVYNVTSGFATVVSDAGTGTNKVVAGNW